MSSEQERVKELEARALDLREHIVQIAHDCPVGIHVGGSLSIADILTVLYFDVLNIDPSDPGNDDRDRLVLSKGHANAALVSVLAMRGFFPLEALKTFDTLGSPYAMHADGKVPGTECSAGSLGHGLPIAVGMALTAKMEGASWKSYAIVGDGEMHEGSMWEALMSANHYQLDNLTVVLDRNRFSLDGPTKNIMTLEPLADKVKAFGWTVIEVNGHSVKELRDALNTDTDGPKMIIANTTKGRGLPFLADMTKSHYARLDDEQLHIALDMINDERANL